VTHISISLFPLKIEVRLKCVEKLKLNKTRDFGLVGCSGEWVGELVGNELREALCVES
jgi:hypothetical protein